MAWLSNCAPIPFVLLASRSLHKLQIDVPSNNVSSFTFIKTNETTFVPMYPTIHTQLVP